MRHSWGKDFPLRLPAYAKLNLSLQVGPERPDGFHEISTIMVKISLHDTLEFRLVPYGINLTASDPNLPCDEGNTVLKAADLLRRRFSPTHGVAIHLEKRIPWGAGLGGGSSDAATTILALNRLWNLSLSRKELMELAAEVGSDVPFFFCASAAVIGGRGELVRPFTHGLKALPLVIWPEIEVSTKWAYQVLTPRLTLDRAITNIAALSCKGGDVKTLAEKACNDFEPVVFKGYPLLMNVVDGLRDRGAIFAGMSGSGSSLFGLFGDEESRRNAYLWAQKRGLYAWAVEWLR